MEGIPILLRFVSKYKIPWILKWQYNLSSTLTVTRIFFVKWWDKYDVNRIVNQVQTEFPPIPVIPIKSVPGSSSKPTKVKKKKSESSSSIELSDINKCSVSELKQLAQAIQNRTNELQEEESTASASSSESAFEDPYGSIDLQDAQDPFA